MYAMSMTCCGDYPVLTVASERTRPLNVIPEGIAAIISCIFLILMSNPLENYCRAVCYASAVRYDLRE
mgnify:FL=1